MKILYITNVRLPTSKAHGLQIMKSCEAFASNGVDMQLIIPNLRPAYNEDPFSFYSVKPNFKIKRIFVLEILALQFIIGRLASYIQNLSFSLSALAYIFFHRIKRSDTIIYSRDYMTLFLFSLFGYSPVAELHDYRSLPYKSRFNYIVKKSRKIIVNSEGTLNALKKHYFMPDSKILIASNGADFDFFDIKMTREEARHRLEIPLGSQVVGYIGRLETVGVEKGVWDLISAFARLTVSDRRIVLYIVGGPDDLIIKYKDETKKLGIKEDKVVFTGHVAYRDIPVYLRAIDTVVIPLPKSGAHSLTTSPMKLFESLAAGKTIVASYLPSIRKLVDGAILFFEPGNISDLAEKILLSLEDRELAEKLAHHAKQEAQKHTWLNRAKNIINFINDEKIV